MSNDTASESRGYFIRTPLARNVTMGEEVVFQCQHTTANGIGWKLNETFLNIYTPPNTTVTSVSLPDGNIYYNLMITALPEYNETCIKCVAILLNEDHNFVETMPVLLLIQGKLDSVSNLRRQTTLHHLFYMWQPSFSLDLTAVMPDVVYCLDVFTVTCRIRKHVISDCGITDNMYNYTNETLDTADLYEAVVTPQINTARAINGTPTSYLDQYASIGDSNWGIIVQLDAESSNMTVELVVNFTTVTETRNVTPDSFIVLFETVDHQGVEQPMCKTAQFSPSKMLFNLPLDCLLPLRRVWLVNLHVGRCKEEQVSNTKELSTHDVQNIVVIGCVSEDKNPRSVSIVGDFINGTSATGILLMLYSSNQADLDTEYISMITFHHPSFHVIFNGLTSEHTYNISAFIVDENGLPFERAATLSQLVHFTSLMNSCDTSQVGKESLISVQINVYPNRNESCILCTFQDKLISSCVAIIHEPASYLLTTNGLLFLNVIKLDRRINESTMTGCIQDDKFIVSYHIVTVFPFLNGSIVGPGVVLQKKRMTDIGSESGLSYALKIALSSAAGGILVIVTPLVTICILVCCCKRKSGDPTDPTGITMHTCDAYEQTSLPSKYKIVLEENAAYAVISSP